MIEIKFRGKTEEGKWGYGYYLVAAGMPFISAFGVREPILILPETVGQYTGLKDGTGKEIYKGDILKSTFETEHQYIATIKYGKYVYTVENCDCDVAPDDGFGLYADFKYKGHDFMCCPVGEFFVDYEIIGNVYDNPELLEAKE